MKFALKGGIDYSDSLPASVYRVIVDNADPPVYSSRIVGKMSFIVCDIKWYFSLTPLYE